MQVGDAEYDADGKRWVCIHASSGLLECPFANPSYVISDGWPLKRLEDYPNDVRGILSYPRGDDVRPEGKMRYKDDTVEA